MEKSLFIVTINYIKPLEEVNEKRGEHLAFISNYVLAGNFLAVGRQDPAVGGVVIAHNMSKEELQNILEQDPYYTNGLANFNIIKFNPGMFAQGVEQLLENLSL